MSKRKITIETRGPIPQKSGIIGPITTPYLEEVGLITRMVVGGIKVVEHKANGEKELLSSRHLKELTANTKVINENRLQSAERTALQERARKEQERVQAETAAKVEAVKGTQVEPEKVVAEEVVGEEVVAEAPAQNKNLSKKERREQARLAEEAAKANAQQEETVEAK